MATTDISSHLTSSPGNIKPCTQNHIYTVRHTGGDVVHGVLAGFEAESEHNGVAVTWYVRTDDLLRVAAEFERMADLCRGCHEEEQDRMEAAVESVADSLRAHMSDAVAGDDTVPHEDVSATGHLVAEAGGA